MMKLVVLTEDRRGLAWTWHRLAQTCCPLPLSDGFCCASTSFSPEEHLGFEGRGYFVLRGKRQLLFSMLEDQRFFTGERCFADSLHVVNERNVTQVSEFLL